MKILIDFKSSFSIILLLINPFMGFGQGSNDTIPFDPELRYGKLKNGFTYYIKKMPKEATGGIIWVELITPGAAFEDKDQYGLAHLMEHMNVYCNTTNFGGLDELFIAWRREGFGNRNYNQTVAGDFSVQYGWMIPKGVPLHNNLLRLREYAWDDQMLQNIQDSTLVDTLGRYTVLQELEANNSSNTRYRRLKTYKLLGEPSKYYSSTYMSDDQIKNIQNFNLSSLVRFYKDWFRPDKQALAVIGDVDVETVEKEIKELFGDLKVPEHAFDKPIKDFLDSRKVNLPKKSRFLHFTTQGNRQDIKLELYTLRNTPEIKIRGEIVNSTIEAYRNQLIQELFEQMVYNRMEQLRDDLNFKEKYIPFTLRVLPFTSLAQVEASHIQVEVNDVEDIHECFDKLMTEIERIKRYGFTDKELEEARNIVISSLLTDIYNPTSLLSAYHNHFLFGATVPDPGYKGKLTRSLLGKISKEEIHAEAQNWFSLPDQAIVLTTSESIKEHMLPNMDDFKSWKEKVKQKTIKPYEDEVKKMVYTGPQSLLPKETLRRFSPQTIGYTIDSIPSMDIIELQLSNGVNIILKPTGKLPNDKIVIQGVGKGNTYIGRRDLTMMDYVLNSLLKSAEFSGWSQEALLEFSKEKGGDISVATLGNRGEVSATTSMQQLENMLQLIYVYMTGLDLNEEKFEAWKTKGETEISELILRNRHLKSNFYNYIDYNLSGRKTEKNIETPKLDTISSDDVYKKYRTMFSQGDKWTFVITGNFTPDAIKPQLLKYFGNLPTGPNPNMPYTNLNDESFYLSPVSSKDTIIYGGDIMNISINYTGKYTYSIQEIVKLQVLYQLLYHKIIAEGKIKGLYRFVLLNFDFDDNNYRLFLNHKMNIKESEEKIIKEIIFDAISDIRENGPDDKALINAVTSYKTNFKNMGMGTTGYISEKWFKDILILQLNNENYIRVKKEQLKFLDKLTPEDIRKAAAKYLKDSRMSIYTQLPHNDKLP